MNIKQHQFLNTLWSRTSHFSTEKEMISGNIQVNDLLSSIFYLGPCYHYIIDFHTHRITNVSSGAGNILGMTPQSIKDIIDRIHPDDLDFATQAEDAVINHLRYNLGASNALKYKMSFCMRIKTANGAYKLFLHQAIILSTDKNGHFAKVLNIHTDISHLSTTNSLKAYLSGIYGINEYIEIDVFPNAVNVSNTPLFSKREAEIIHLLAKGMKNKEIADQLFISLNTVKNHRKNILQKSGMKNCSELIARCFIEGLV